MFLTSLKQTCNEYLIKFSENQSAPMLENRETSPCSSCAPNLLHVLVSRILGYHNLYSPGYRLYQGRQITRLSQLNYSATNGSIPLQLKNCELDWIRNHLLSFYIENTAKLIPDWHNFWPSIILLYSNSLAKWFQEDLGDTN